MKNVVLTKNNHLKVSLAWHYFAQSHKTSWKKSIFEKNKMMPQAGFEPTSSWLLEWSLSEFCHKDSCFTRVEIRIYKNVQWSAPFNFCHQVTTVLLHCDMWPRCVSNSRHVRKGVFCDVCRMANTYECIIVHLLTMYICM